MPAPSIVSAARTEWVGDVPFVLNSTQTLPSRGGNLPNNYYLFGLLLEVEGRCTRGAGAVGAEEADSPYSIVEEVRVSGFHRGRGKNELFFRMRGADLREFCLDYMGRAPFSTGALGTGVSSSTDFRFMLPVPFVPLGIPLAQQLLYLLDAPNYDNLLLEVQWGDAESLYVNGATGPTTFTAFGLGTGSPRARVHCQYTLGGPAGMPGFLPARVWRYALQEKTDADMTGGGANLRLFNIPRGNVIRSLLLKTGVKETTVTSPNNAYASLSNTILSDIRVMRGTNKQIREWQSYFGLREDSAEQYLITPSNGYGLIDFAPHGDIREALDTSSLISGPTGDVDLFVQATITGAANQAALMYVEEIRGVPVGV